jgi:hypothetical protein
MAKIRRQAAANRIAGAAKKSGEQIGAIVYWACEGVSIESDKLKKVFQKHKLDEARWFPPPIESSVVFSKALREVKRDGHLSTEDGRVLIRPINKSDTEIVIGVVDETRDKAKQDLTYDVPCKVVFTKETDQRPASVAIKGKQHPAAVAIKQTFNDLKDKYITRDITRMLVRNIYRRMGSICLRSTGGVYFAPAAYTDEVQKHQDVVESLGGSEFYFIPIYGDAVTKNNLGRQVKRSLEEELKELQVKLQEFKTEKAPRPDTAARRVEDFKALKDKVSMYSSMLSLKVGDLNQGIKDAAQGMKALLGDLEKARDEKKTKRSEDSKEKRAQRRKDRKEAKGKKNGAPKKKTAKKKVSKKKTARKMRKPVQQQATA